MDKASKIETLKIYLGTAPAWFDIRKRELLRDGIDLFQWRINMSYLIQHSGNFEAQEAEQQAFSAYMTKYKGRVEDDYYWDDYLDQHTTPLVKFFEFNRARLPEILWDNQDRKWFYAGYPDVMDFFYPMIDDSDDTVEKVKKLTEERRPICDRMSEALPKNCINNQTVFLVELKNYYRDVLKNHFMLKERGT